MAFHPLKLCPLSCLVNSKPKQNFSGSNVSSEAWELLEPLQFCAEVFPEQCNHASGRRDPSNVCWFCDVDRPMRGKFVAKKSTDPIPDNIRRVQEKLGFRAGEPLTKHNLQNIIPSLVWRKRKADHLDNAQRRKTASPRPQAASPNVPPSLRKSLENHSNPPLKKFAYYRPENAGSTDKIGAIDFRKRLLNKVMA